MGSADATSDVDALGDTALEESAEDNVDLERLVPSDSDEVCLIIRKFHYLFFTVLYILPLFTHSPRSFQWESFSSW